MVPMGGSVTVRAIQAAATTIPIVFAVGGDPVKLGFVVSFSRPGGNGTGVSDLLNALVAKRLQLLRPMPAAKPSSGRPLQAGGPTERCVRHDRYVRCLKSLPPLPNNCVFLWKTSTVATRRNFTSFLSGTSQAAWFGRERSTSFTSPADPEREKHTPGIAPSTAKRTRR
jgi:hypothetical protein